MKDPSRFAVLNDDTQSPVLSESAIGSGAARTGISRDRARRWFFHRVMRLFMALYSGALATARLIGPRPAPRRNRLGHEILLTGRFESDNWIKAHIHPLAASSVCSRLHIVSTYPVPPIPKVVPVYPPQWLVRAVGKTPARLLLFASTAIRTRPEVVGGFHLLVNGLVAILLARLIGARSLYFCVGGPPELVDGGIRAGGGPFARMETPDRIVERRLLDAVDACDLVITMGTTARAFFRQRSVRTEIHVVSGGIDVDHAPSCKVTQTIDLIVVARLTEVKRIETFLKALQHVTTRIPSTSAVVVGDGKCRARLERLARALGVDRHIRFIGHQRSVNEWLARSKVFVLTSRSEGLSLALMEAMMCGLPAVVSNVGDLADLVEDGVNGYLVDYHSPEAFAVRIAELLADEHKLTSFSEAAHRSALPHEMGRVTRRWEAILRGTVTCIGL